MKNYKARIMCVTVPVILVMSNLLFGQGSLKQGFIKQEFFKVDSTGNVGIGTTTPSAKLEVNGDIRVTGGSFIDDGKTLKSADYVFGSDYPLESIEAHAEFMWREKHLPAVSSAKEIQTSGGYNISERREQMLEELEKAHIYIERLHDRLKALENKLAKLEAR